MCLCFKRILRDFKKISKQWTIRKKMMVFFFLVAIIACFQIFMLILIVFTIIDAETSEKLEKTLNQQAQQNMQTLVHQGAIYVQALLISIGSMFNFINGVIYQMNFQDTFSLDYQKTYSFQQGIYYCNSNFQNISLQCQYYSITQPLQFNYTWLHKMSRLQPYWKPIFGLTNQLVLRYMVYFPVHGFYLVYPGMPTNRFEEFQVLQDLFKTLIYGGEQMRVRLPENKEIYNQKQSVVTLYQPLYDLDFRLVGLILADLKSETLFRNISNMRYLQKGSDIALIYKDGQIIRYGNIKGNNFEIIQDYTSPQFWQYVLNNPHSTTTNIVNGTINRVSTAPVYLADDGDTFWFILMLVQTEQQILKYKREAKDDIRSSMFWYFLITLASSLLTIGVVILVTHSISKKTTRPLQKMIDFSKKISASSHKKVVLQQELFALQQGQGQVAELVRAYKQMAKGLIWKSQSQNFPLQVLNTQLYPPNQLWQTDRINWLENLIQHLHED